VEKARLPTCTISTCDSRKTTRCRRIRQDNIENVFNIFVIIIEQQGVLNPTVNFLLRMRRNGQISTSGVKFDVIFELPVCDFL